MANKTNRSPAVGAALAAALSKDRQFYLDVLAGNECACGREKPPRRAFCGRCYYALPGDLQVDIQAVYNVGANGRSPKAGFAEAYEEAIKHLEEEGLIR
jgi:hypothetical protein